MIVSANSEEIRRALAKILESRTFEKSSRARDLLAYIVEQDLDGNSASVKGFSIAVDVFGRDESFDATSDPLVRVHAGRLRELIASYYEDEGRDDPLRITVPLGGYRPVYSSVEAPAAQTVTDVTPVQSHDGPVQSHDGDEAKAAGASQHLDDEIRRLQDIAGQPNPAVKHNIRKLWLSVLALASVAILVGGYFFYQNSSGSAIEREDIEREDIRQDAIAAKSFLPVVQVIADLNDPDLKAFGERLTSALAGYDTITSLKLRPESVLERRANSWTPLDYAIRIIRTRSKTEDGVAIVTTDLISLNRNEVIRSENHPIDAWENPGAAFVAARKLTNIAAPEGVIYADIVANGSVNPLLECMLRVRAYYSLSNRANHKAAFECTETFLTQTESSGLMKAIHGGLIAEAAGKNFEYRQIPNEAADAFAAALIIALKGVDQSPSSARSAREVGFVYSWQGAFIQMTSWFERAFELNPNDTSIAASYGYGLVLTGEYEKAIDVLGGAIKATTRHPTWWDFYYGLALLMEGRFDEASIAIQPMGLARRGLLYTALNAVLAFEKQDRIRSAFLVRELRERYPRFAANPQGSFEKRHFPRKLIDTLVEGLSRAGL